ncbi:mannosyl-3-phosphoglycerate synthase [Archaeoglobus veneficus]|uniref:Mannosyl-3-phosphoglycerate synthase n=1 Tax=Archaeoglobus veneficus (strain DSM 11195 / SNP6) TaxID=693661 RepID=F2KSW1_ARCVS|nr:mannosyl-3-phosphoglycerate synthase [Archaeoglobus veneficus]AEA47006.1 mannosyl-3-phosphoglycerate synthase [Archaeoglobus veneficus SNP6]
MLIEAPRHAEIFGSVKIYDVQKVLKLDSEKIDTPLLRSFSKDEIEEVLNKLSVIIPIKNEKIHLLDGVLRAVPRSCPIIVVSNSQRGKRDVFKMERDVIAHFHNLTKHPVTVIHQKDPGLGLAFKEVGYDRILDENGFVRDGKAEGMIAGLLLAKHMGKEYVGFVDADNYVPCAVNEYIKDFAAGLCMSESPYAMVRLHWRHKPKIVKSKLYFRKWGRVSEVTNRYLNLLLAAQTGFETHIIKTGNAGEHAMTMRLAEIMGYSTGYSIEPYQYIYLLEEFWKGEGRYSEATSAGIEVFQIETLNPHIHEEKGEKHVKDMLHDSLSTIYHSRLSDRQLKSKILEELKANNVLKEGEKPRKNITIPPIKEIDVNSFMKILEEYSETLVKYE